MPNRIGFVCRGAERLALIFAGEMTNMRVLQKIDGNKTYIVAGIAALAAFAQFAGLINEAQLEQIYLFLAPFGFAAMRSAITK